MANEIEQYRKVYSGAVLTKAGVELKAHAGVHGLGAADSACLVLDGERNYLHVQTSVTPTELRAFAKVLAECADAIEADAVVDAEYTAEGVRQ